jgi:DNA-binding transcriptional LysR family regulator
LQSTIPRKQWLGIEFRHLAALAAIAEEGSFRAAADRLGYVQSAVSQQVAHLERTLDVRLIERAPGSHPVALTDAGRLILGHFEDILVKLGAAWADVEALSDGRAGAVRIGAPASIEARIVPEVLPRLAHGSDIRVSVTQCVDDAACDALADTRIDAALISGPLPDGPLVGHRVIEDPLVLLVPADAPLARRGTAPRLAEVGALALIGRSAARDTETAAAEFEALGVQPRVVHASDDDATSTGRTRRWSRCPSAMRSARACCHSSGTPSASSRLPWRRSATPRSPPAARSSAASTSASPALPSPPSPTCRGPRRRAPAL